MIRRSVSRAIITFAFGVLLSGCASGMSDEQVRTVRPERSPDLERLAVFTGRWESVGEGRLAGVDEPVKLIASSETVWDCDGWCMVERGVVQMGDLGETAVMVVWTWDAREGLYRVSWFDNHGGTAVGTASYDEASDTWRLKAAGRGPEGRTNFRGAARFPDGYTMVWAWTEWDRLMMTRKSDLQGTTHRK